jgi:hypothetical protein
VAFVSISHVTKWYAIGNPISWAIYLSIAVEIAALSSLAAIVAKMGKRVIFPFLIVTLIQFIGNIFFTYQYITIDNQIFKDWVDLFSPIGSFIGIEPTDLIGHKRLLSFLIGGMLPIISLSFLGLLVKFEEEYWEGDTKKINDKPEEELIPEQKIDAKDIISEVSRIRLKEDDLEALEKIIQQTKPLTNREDTIGIEEQPPFGGIPGNNIDPNSMIESPPPHTLEDEPYIPTLSDEEIMEMNQNEYEHNFDVSEDENDSDSDDEVTDILNDVNENSQIESEPMDLTILPIYGQQSIEDPIEDIEDPVQEEVTEHIQEEIIESYPDPIQEVVETTIEPIVEDITPTPEPIQEVVETIPEPIIEVLEPEPIQEVKEDPFIPEVVDYVQPKNDEIKKKF